MQVHRSPRGLSWTVRADDGRELGVIHVARVRSAQPMYCAYGPVLNGYRWDLGLHVGLETAVERVVAFDLSDPGHAHRVRADAVERRRR